MAKLKLLDYMGLVLEALPCGIPLALDHIMSKKIENDDRYVTGNSKGLPLTTDQQLRLDPQYSTYRFFDGVLTRRTKSEALDKLRKSIKQKEDEHRKPYPALAKDENTRKDVEIRVILPEEIKQE